MICQFVGFNIEREPLIRSSVEFSKMFVEHKYNSSDRAKVIACLEDGVFLTGAMLYIYDDEKKPIGNLDYFTNGRFVWPIYYLYYLKKYDNFYIDSNLLNFALTYKKGDALKIGSILLKSIEKAFDKEWSGEYPDLKN